MNFLKKTRLLLSSGLTPVCLAVVGGVAPVAAFGQGAVGAAPSHIDENGVSITEQYFVFNDDINSITVGTLSYNHIVTKDVKNVLLGYGDRPIMILDMPGNKTFLIYNTGSVIGKGNGRKFFDQVASGPRRWNARDGDGSYFIEQGVDEFVYHTAEGEEITYKQYSSQRYIGGPFRIISRVKRANGEIIDYSNRIIGTGATATYVGPQTISSSNGYLIHFEYESDVINNAGYRRVKSIKGYNRATDSCLPGANQCPAIAGQPRLDFSYGTDSTTITNSAGLTSTFAYGNVPSEGYQLRIRFPSGVAANKDDIAVTYDHVVNGSDYGAVKVAKGGNVWNYSWNISPADHIPGNMSSVSVLAPDGARRDYEFQRSTDNQVNRITRVTDALQGETVYEYDTWSRLTSVEYPEGNTVNFVRNAFGDVTQATRVSATPAVDANLVEQFTYPATCANLKTCHSPLTHRDARLNVTNFTYDGVHGGVTSIRLPADTAGVRPETRITYGNRQAYYRNTAGSIVASGSNIALPLQISSCQTAASCIGGVGERRVVVDYGPQTAGTANTLNPVSVTTSLGDGSLAATTALTYDKYGRALDTDGPLAGAADLTRTRYDAAGRVIGVVAPDPDGSGSARFQAVRYVYNNLGQRHQTQIGTVTAQTDAAWADFVEKQRYTDIFDDRGRLIRQTLGVGGVDYSVVDYLYDAAGRVSCTVTYLDSTQWGVQALECAPLQTNSPHGPDRVVQNTYDALGRLTKVTEAAGTTLAASAETREFTANGNIAWVEDAEGNRTSYLYDGHNRRVETRYPSGNKGDGVSSTTDVERLTYDENGNIRTFRTRRNEILTMTYDNLNRLTRKQVPTPTGLTSAQTEDVFYAYDLHNNLTSARFGSASGQGVTNAFNALGQLTGTTVNLDGLTRTLGYQYDIAGNRTRITHPDGNYFQYVRHAAGELNEISLNGSTPLIKFLLNEQGQLDRMQRRRPSVANWTSSTASYHGYDAVARLNSLTINITGTNRDATTQLTYNSTGQIVSRTRDNDVYAWDTAMPGGRNYTYTANGLNQYQHIATNSGPLLPAYDANGNMVSDGTNTYVYDVENRLVSHARGGVTTTLRYDPLGRLYEMANTAGTTRFLHDGNDMVAEFNGAGALLRRYAHGLGSGDDPLVWFEGNGLADAARRYLYMDERGSVIAVTNAEGNALNVNSYDEYGIPGSTNTGRFQYTGQAWLGDIGLYYYKARMYSPTLGRFMQTDPIGYGDGMNIYAYSGGDPVNGFDPSGLSACSPYRYSCPSPVDLYHEFQNPGSPPGPGRPHPFYWFEDSFKFPGYGAPPLISTIPFRGNGSGAATPSKDVPCPSGARLSLGYGVSGTGFLASMGLSLGVGVGISVPIESLLNLSLRGVQGNVNGSATFLTGLGAFAGAGPAVNGGGSSGPLEQGYSPSASLVAQGGLANGAGGELSVPLTQNGKGITGIDGASLSGGRKYGTGGYGAIGAQRGFTVATPQFGCK